MKTCVNEQCRATLDDYVNRCPHCGRLQGQRKIVVEIPKMDVVREVIKEPEDTSFAPHERNGFVTFWLWMILVANMIGAVIAFFPKTMWGSNYPDQYVAFSVASGVFGLVTVFGAQLLLSWKKIGFVVILVSSICNGLIALFTSGSFPVGIIGLVILWMILQLKKNGKSCWEQLK